MAQHHISAHRSSGYTLAELIFVLLVLATLFARALGPLRDLRDRMAVVSAREAVVAHFFRARVQGMMTGSARLIASEADDALLVESPASSAPSWVPGGPRQDELRLLELYGVELELEGTAEVAVLRYDAMGLGRTLGRTFTLRKGRMQAHLVVSSYGRIRRS